MKKFDEVERGDNLFIFVEGLEYLFTDSVESINNVSYGSLDIINIYTYKSGFSKYSVLGESSFEHCYYSYNGIKYDAIIFTTKYEAERYIKKLAMEYSEKAFRLNELLYNM